MAFLGHGIGECGHTQTPHLFIKGKVFDSSHKLRGIVLTLSTLGLTDPLFTLGGSKITPLPHLYFRN